VGASHAIELGLTAANRVASEGVDAEVVDLRTVKPMDVEIIEESVKKTGRLLIVDTGWSMGGVCAEIGCLAAERWLEHLKAQVRRIGLPDIPTPAGFTLEQFYYPDVERISAAMRELVRARSVIAIS
jgi:pyruvate dehydrogenase E1 component beta subunit